MPDFTSVPEDEVSPPTPTYKPPSQRHQKERREKDNRRPPVFGRIGKKVSDTQTANLQNLDTHENKDRRISTDIGWQSRFLRSAAEEKARPQRLLNNAGRKKWDPRNPRTNIVKDEDAKICLRP
ncbi:hypothetical protein Tco_1003444 [Tanacetum coccineum]|uniref:Uncharacterized protein n=1 Tax=Tanacetum coccineum TaxID=301880 RepID=A0ABQ5F945_9ASTR